MHCTFVFIFQSLAERKENHEKEKKDLEREKLNLSHEAETLAEKLESLKKKLITSGELLDAAFKVDELKIPHVMLDLMLLEPTLKFCLCSIEQTRQ